MKQRFFAQTLGFLLILSIGAGLLCACRFANRDGWRTEDGTTYYFSGGRRVTGWLELEGQRYFFDDGGAMVTGLREIDGETFFFQPDGIMATGWQALNGKYAYFRSNGSRVTGWLSLEGKRHYLMPDGFAMPGPQTVDGIHYLFDAQGQTVTGWLEVDGKHCYGDETGRPVTGWQTIDGARYCFDENGFQITGWIEHEGFRYYFLPSGAPAQGALTLEGETYYFTSFGQQILLVNPWHFMPAGYTVDLTGIGNGHQVASIAYEDYLEMISDCRGAGLRPVVCSSYRTQEYQEKLFARKVSFYTEKGYSEEDAKVQAGRSVAVPGTSEHQLGLALDIIDNRNWKLDESQAETETQQWLMENSWRYGWILRYPDGTSDLTGIIFEPWHYRYVGREAAADIHRRGVCLEAYLDLLTQAQTSVG